MLGNTLNFIQQNKTVKFFLAGLVLAVILIITGHASLFLLIAVISSIIPIMVGLPIFEDKLNYDQRQQAESSFLLLTSVFWAMYMWISLQDYPQKYSLVFVTIMLSGLAIFASLKKRVMVVLPVLLVFVAINVMVSAEPDQMLILATVVLAVMFLLFKAPLPEITHVVSSNPEAPVGEDSSAKFEMIAEIDRLKGKNKELMEDVRQAKVDLSAAEMAKMEFLATMSHEIRTPLNGIIPLLDILLDSEVTDFQRDYLSTAHVSAIQMQKLIDDLLDFSKVEAGNLSIETKGLKIMRVLEAVKSSYKQAADKKGLKVEIEMARNVSPLLRGDPTRLRQVLSNLVSNAVKFSNNGTIRIVASKLKDSPTKEIIRFEVIDQGVGLDKETADNIFKPFTQEDGSSTRKFGGTGLGLAISKKIIELMHGTIGVESSKGKGSNFYFDLPLLKSMGETSVGITEKSPYQAIVVNTNPLLFNKISQNLKLENIPFQKALGLPQAYEIYNSMMKISESTKSVLLFIDFETAGKQVRTLCSDLAKDTKLNSLYACIITESGQIAGVPQLPNIKLVSKGDSISELLNKLEVLQASQEARAEAEKQSEGIISGDTEDQGVLEENQEQKPSHDKPNVKKPEHLQAVKAASQRDVSEKILLVEDNEINLKVAEKLIQYIGYDFDFATNGKEALDKVKDTRYRMILMDCLMPVMDGYRCTENIRKHEEKEGLNRTPILAMTANAMLGDREKCLDAGMDDYMSKPLNRYILEKTLKKWDPFESGNATPAQTEHVITKQPIQETESSESKKDALEPVETQTTSDASQEKKQLLSGINQKWLNTKSLEKIKEFMGDEVVQLLEMYEKETPVLISKMSKALNEQNFEEIQKLAHMLKSTSANIGANGLSFFSRKMELAAEISDGSQQDEIYKKIRKAYALTKPEITKYIQAQ